MSDVQNNRGKGQQIWKIQRMKTSPALPLSLLQVQWKNIIFFRWRPILRKIREKRNNNSKQFKKSTKTKTNKQEKTDQITQKKPARFHVMILCPKAQFCNLGHLFEPWISFCKQNFWTDWSFQNEKVIFLPKADTSLEGSVGSWPCLTQPISPREWPLLVPNPSAHTRGGGWNNTNHPQTTNPPPQGAKMPLPHPA